MGIEEELEGIHEEIDWISTVSVVSGGNTIENVKALKRAMNFKEVALAGALGIEPTAVVWNLWRSTLQEASLSQGDRVITAGNAETWVIQAVDLATFATRYRCICTLAR